MRSRLFQEEAARLTAVRRNCRPAPQAQTPAWWSRLEPVRQRRRWLSQDVNKCCWERPELECPFFQHPRRNQLLLNVPLQNLDQEFAQVSGLRFGPTHLRKGVYGRAKHARSEKARFRRKLRRRKTLVVGAHQSVGKGVEVGAIAIQIAPADHAFGELRQ